MAARPRPALRRMLESIAAFSSPTVVQMNVQRSMPEPTVTQRGSGGDGDDAGGDAAACLAP